MDVKKLFKSKCFWALFVAVIGDMAMGAASDNLGTLASNVTQSYENIGKLMVSTAYLAGIGFGIAAIFKFKQHKDNPTQIPVGTPFTLLAVSAALVFLPGLYAPLGSTIFGSDSHPGGGYTGGGASSIPGNSGK